jgi:hypothetical protein
MGLDIYLYTKDRAAADAEREHAWDEVYDSGRWNAMSDEEKDAWRLEHPYPDRDTDTASRRYPDHLFNRRYLRSSYNGAGFNHAVPQMIGSSGDGETYPNERGSLYWVFEPMGREWDGDEGTLTVEDIPKLAASKARALEVADALRKSDRLRVLTVSPNMFSAPPQHTDDDALRMYREHIAARQPDHDDDGWYMTRDLEVYGAGLTILCAVAGKATFDIPGVHLIYRAGVDGYESYIQSAEITAEFCDEAIFLIERDGSCSLSWSG